MSASEPIWSFKVSLDEIPEDGAHFDLAADDEVRAALASAAGLRELRRLEASFDVDRHGTDSLRVAGEVSASVGQNCVVTLEPVESELNEDVDLIFSPPMAGEPAAHGKATLTLGDAGAPDVLTGGAVDLGAIATEFLLLGIEPYPRKDGAVFEPPAAPEDPTAHPFAALAALKKDHSGNGG